MSDLIALAQAYSRLLQSCTRQVKAGNPEGANELYTAAQELLEEGLAALQSAPLDQEALAFLGRVIRAAQLAQEAGAYD